MSLALIIIGSVVQQQPILWLKNNFIILILVAHYKFKCPFVVGVLVALMEALEVYSKRSNMEKSPLFKSPMLRWLLSLMEW